MNTLERARGRWKEILPRLGIDTRYLQNRHGPCPLCGGRDRYRWDDKDGSGSYYCNQCGPGSGVTLAQKKNNWDFRTACEEIDRIIGDGPAEPKAPVREDVSGERRRACERVLNEAGSPDVVTRYLQGRGLSIVPPTLRGHSALPYFEDRRLVGKYPAVVAPVLGPDGSLQSVHRLYVADVPDRKKTMLVVDTIKGAAVRLFEAGDVLGVAEGIETAIAAFELFRIPTWACLTAGGLEALQVPDTVTELTVFGDNDASYAGQKAAYSLANRITTRTDIDVQVQIPPEIGSDWLDVLNQQCAA